MTTIYKTLHIFDAFELGLEIFEQNGKCKGRYVLKHNDTTTTLTSEHTFKELGNRNFIQAIILQLEKKHEIKLEQDTKNEIQGSILRASQVTQLEQDISTHTALELLKSPNLFFRVKKILDFDVTGEDKNKLVGFLASLSSRADIFFIVLVKSESSAGKTAVVNAVTQFFNTWKVGRLSETALDYKEDLGSVDLIYIQELTEEQSSGHFRLLSSRDGGYSIAVTIRKKGGEGYEVYEKQIPPKTLFITSTGFEFEPQLDTRAITLNIDESEEQTKAILRHKTQKHKDELMSILNGRQPNTFRKSLEEAIDLLESCAIFIPYIDDLTKVFSTTILRVRSDFDKLVDLIKLSAFLHQYQRPMVEHSNHKIVLATLHDVANIYVLAQDIFLKTATGIEQRLEEVYNTIKELIDQKHALNEPTEEGEEKIPIELTIKEISSEIPTLSRKRIWKVLDILSDKGLVVVFKKEGFGNVNFYKLGNEDKAFLSFKMEIPPLPELELSIRKTISEYFTFLPQETMTSHIQSILHTNSFINPLTGEAHSIRSLLWGEMENSPISKHTTTSHKDEQPSISSYSKRNAKTPTQIDDMVELSANFFIGEQGVVERMYLGKTKPPSVYEQLTYFQKRILQVVGSGHFKAQVKFQLIQEGYGAEAIIHGIDNLVTMGLLDNSEKDYLKPVEVEFSE